jgi:hypothetical protein
MNGNESDWYPTIADKERLIYENIDLKIDGFKAKYSFLTSEYLAQIHTMCAMFIEGYDKIEFNRASAKAVTTWFQNVVESRQKNELVDAPPVFQAFTIPAGALVGLEQQCRAFARLMKSQSGYDRADGLDLMIEKAQGAAINLNEAQPELKLEATLSNVVLVGWKKAGFDSLELQYRKAGTEMWQLADKSTEKEIEFPVPLATPGVPEKFEFRAVYIIKNQRVGQWSQIYILIVG